MPSPGRQICSALAIVGAFTTLAAVAQVAPKWEVGAIRRNVSGSGSASLNTRGEKLVGVNITAEMLIRSAYPFESYRISGAPNWWSADRYDISGVASAPATPEQVRVMTQQLLAERFKLAAHVETRELNTYRLVLARVDGRLGPSLTRFADDCEALRASGKLASLPAPRTVEDLAVVRPCMSSQGQGMYAGGGRPLADLARLLAGELRAPVIDRTGLTGNYNIALRWNPDPTRTGVDAPFPSLLTALQEQLGLKLESARDPIEVIVNDRRGRPAVEYYPT